MAQYALRRSYTIYYKRPFRPQKPGISPVVRVMQRVAKVRMLLDAGVESADIGIVYLIRLYSATFAILAVLFTLLAAAPFTFALPYMFQVKHITPIGWEARFQCLTVVIVSLPLLLGSMVTLVAWGGPKPHPTLHLIFALTFTLAPTPTLPQP